MTDAAIKPGQPMQPVYVVFDGQPGPEGPRFVEVERPDGSGVKVGEWQPYMDGLWRLGPLYVPQDGEESIDTKEESATLEEEPATLERDISAVLNRHSAENDSNTPDFILAQFLIGCLAVWDIGVQQRETWYGRDARPSEGGFGSEPSDG